MKITVDYAPPVAPPTYPSLMRFEELVVVQTGTHRLVVLHCATSRYGVGDVISKNAATIDIFDGLLPFNGELRMSN